MNLIEKATVDGLEKGNCQMDDFEMVKDEIYHLCCTENHCDVDDVQTKVVRSSLNFESQMDEVDLGKAYLHLEMLSLIHI